MSKLISVEYEQDFCHFPSEMQIGDDEVSWWVEYLKPLLLHVPDRSSTLASMIVPLPFGS